MPGLLRISVQRGINLAARNHPKRSPYAAVRISKQTRVVRKTVNPEWRDDLTVAVLDPRQPISVTVYDRNMFSVDEKMGDAEFDVRPNALPNGTISTRISPSSSNCLLRNIESGQVKLQLRWIDILPGFE
ncbi:hypothetical protein MIMGU_mgv1a021031mg [Erythranthe guttata]|uniref:C2 domain-containing protein n=1 Tax=Erythranthe guttata TaxID=4155 RepID=A0A022Q981_ERYGU|nr:hypothetical protein MIMGU_mgv1a021031mg [Erythranthe guttata]